MANRAIALPDEFQRSVRVRDSKFGKNPEGTHEGYLEGNASCEPHRYTSHVLAVLNEGLRLQVPRRRTCDLRAAIP